MNSHDAYTIYKQNNTSGERHLFYTKLDCLRTILSCYHKLFTHTAILFSNCLTNKSVLRPTKVFLSSMKYLNSLEQKTFHLDFYELNSACLVVISCLLAYSWPYIYCHQSKNYNPYDEENQEHDKDHLPHA